MIIGSNKYWYKNPKQNHSFFKFHQRLLLPCVIKSSPSLFLFFSVQLFWFRLILLDLLKNKVVLFRFQTYSNYQIHSVFQCYATLHAIVVADLTPVDVIHAVVSHVMVVNGHFLNFILIEWTRNKIRKKKYSILV
jgi:hypothetical protein